MKSYEMKGCPQNIAIFGHLYRKDCDFTDTILDCEIHNRNFHKAGAVSIVELSDTEVKVQFLEGRSKRNYYTSKYRPGRSERYGMALFQLFNASERHVCRQHTDCDTQHRPVAEIHFPVPGRCHSRCSLCISYPRQEIPR